MVTVRADESIYFDMYTWGLKQIPIIDIEHACRLVGKEIRQKDYDNYYRGYHKSWKKDPKNILRFGEAKGCSGSPEEKLKKDLLDFDKYPVKYEVEQRWVPCNENNKPMIKWSKGCLMLDEAKAWNNSVYLAENLYQTQYVVIDCDGDHNSKLDLESIFFLYNFRHVTDCREKPKKIQEYEGYEVTGCTVPASFHITFWTDRIIPTIHCPWAHVDILGNQNNQLRYLKNKEWNGKRPALLTREIWDEITWYLLRRKEEETWE